MDKEMDRNLTLHGIIGNGMILQQGVSVPIWGKYTPGAPVTLNFLDKTYRTVADAAGAWMVHLEAAGPGGPYTMTIRGEGDKNLEPIVLKDLYIGDVWLCSGQSNMELPMNRVKDEYPEEWKPPINGLLRQFKVNPTWDFSGPQEDLPEGCAWVGATEGTLGDFGATGWFFAKALYEKHRTPIGLINAAAGGSPIEAWMSKDALKEFPQALAQGAQYGDADFRESVIKKSAFQQQTWYEGIQREDEGLSPEAPWYLPGTDDSAWEAITLPGYFADAGLGEFCGVIWLRKTVKVPPEMAGKPARLWLGTIIDADTVFINGVAIGATTYRYPPRKYGIPEGLLQEGDNQIAIRVICCNGNGGFTLGKPFYMFFGTPEDDTCISLQGIWKYKTTAQSEPKPGEFFIQWQPTGLFNGMIAPLLRYPVRGVIWYQGESNEGNAAVYGHLFTAMIQDWRIKKAAPQLPFLFVQLPLFGAPGANTEDSGWALVREAQQSGLTLPHTGMAVALDLGEWNDLHPTKKKPVGYRLALAAGKALEGERNGAPGPLLQSIDRIGNKLILTFDPGGTGLVIKPAPMYVTMVSKEGIKTPLPGELWGINQISVDISSIREPWKILYAWADNPADRALYNNEGLPAIPFRRIIPAS
jgi:sialate O-acetylesterase